MKSGFVMLAGRSNVGKSTLLNTVIGSKVAIISPKPQTTRHPVRGILHDPRGQIVFVDTPGVFLGKKDRVSKRLNELVSKSLDGIDAVVYVVDPAREPGKEEEYIQNLLKKIKTPILLAINKKDLTLEQKPFLENARAIDIGQEGSAEISAKTGTNLNLIIDKLFELMPEGEPFYPDLQMTDTSHEKWIEEVIREKCFLALDQELPYTIHVHVDGSETEGRVRKIHATIFTTDDRYKGMVIGKGAQKLKEIGTAARKELEGAMDGSVFLDLQVKVDPKWQERFE